MFYLRQGIIYPLEAEPTESSPAESRSATPLVNSMGHTWSDEDTCCTNRRCITARRVQIRRLAWPTLEERAKMDAGEEVERRYVIGWNWNHTFAPEPCGKSWDEQRENPTRCKHNKRKPMHRLPDRLMSWSKEK
jgi:hypothetical protein